MNKDVILGFVRHVLTFGGGFIVANGALSVTDLETAVGAIITLAGVAWSAYNKRA